MAANNKEWLKQAIKKAQASGTSDPALLALIDKITAKLPGNMREASTQTAADAVVKAMQVLKGFGVSGMDKLQPITPMELMTMLKLSSDKKATMDKKIEGTAALVDPKLNKALDEALERNRFEDAVSKGEAKIRVVPKRK